MICKPSELKFEDKKFCIVVAGVPGIGKTTLALSAPKPLLIDLDNGIDRVEARYRTDTDKVGSFEELQKDLTTTDLSNYETIVIDTGGKLLEMLKPVVISEDPKNGKRNGELTLQGYGAVKRRFSSFISFVKSLDKHLVIIFHATEVSLKDDMTGLRIRIEGRSRDEVWDDVDIGGFVEMVGNKRTIGFNNCDRYYAKGTHGVHGVYEIPNLDKGSKNTFLTDLINKMITDLNSENSELQAYNEVMNTITPKIKSSGSKEALNASYEEMKNAHHSLTSKNELWAMINEKAKELGLKYDKGTNSFIE